MIERLCVIGVGLIGGSLARALRAVGMVGEVVGASRNAGHLQRAVDLGVIDRFDIDLARAVMSTNPPAPAVRCGVARNRDTFTDPSASISRKLSMDASNPPAWK